MWLSLCVTYDFYEIGCLRTENVYLHPLMILIYSGLLSNEKLCMDSL